jgi:hypothetical protein
VPDTGSQRPLQQSARAVHATPGAAQLPAGRQTLPTQRPEQHSGATVQGPPLP